MNPAIVDDGGEFTGEESSDTEPELTGGQTLSEGLKLHAI